MRNYSIAPIALALFVIACSSGRSGDSGEARREADSLRAAADSLQAVLDFTFSRQARDVEECRAELLMARDAIYRSRTFLPEYELTRLRELGFEDPARTILEDMTRQTQFLPVTAPGLSRFAFRSEQSFLVAPSTVIAYFDDGHTDGYAVLEYRIDRDGAIRWQSRCRTEP